MLDTLSNYNYGRLLTMNNTLYVILIIVGIVLVLSLVFLFIVLSNRKKKKTLTTSIDQTSINSVISYLGGTENIISASIEGARMSFRVKSTNHCQLDKIKTLGALGIFVTGTTIKMMLPYDAKELIYQINQLLKGEN